MGTPHCTDPAAALRREMAAAGLHTSAPIILDGALHRVHIEGDRRGSRNGWYVLHPDAPASGAFGSWKLGVSGTWTAGGGERLSEAARAELRRRAEAAEAARLACERARQEEARQRARNLWKSATPARPDHPYLVRKQITAGSARQLGAHLVLPVADLGGRLWSLQFIGPDGDKKLLSCGRKRAHCIPVAGRRECAARVLVCEGWATGRTLAEMEPAALVLAAIDAGNLEPVAVAVRRRWPAAEIVVCCDADDVGTRKGRAAAVAAGALVAVPSFPPGVEGSDYNDLAAALQEVAA